MSPEKLEELNKRFETASAQEVVNWFVEEYKGKIALSSSLGAEDQVLTDMVAKSRVETTIFTLDTGRLFSETYDLISRTCNKYKLKIKVYFPDHNEVEEMVNEKGMNLFYNSIENRKLCCQIRKLKPLKRAFKGLDAWICGLRADQAVTRQNVKVVEWDELNNILKINPLVSWSEEQVWAYIKENKVPYNKLHDKDYPSIGCQPCTRAVMEGEDVRAGRWWWESPDSKECGLHKR